MDFVNGIYGLVPEEEWLDVGFDINRPADPVDSLIGDEKTDNLVARWQTIATEYQIPVMAQFHGFDTEAQTTFRVPIDTHNIEKGLIKVKLNQSERMRELIRSGVREDALVDYVLNDGIRLADQVVTRSKVAKNELLATGKVTIKENDLDLDVDYGVPEENTSLTLTINDKADVPAQIQTIIDTALKQGITINGMITSRQNISKLRMNKSIQTIINGSNSVGALVRASDFDAYLSEEFGIDQIITNDLTYGASASIDPTTNRPTVVQKRYFPKDKITFYGTAYAQNRLGVGLWGDPPEVTINGFSTASTTSPYVYISQWHENDPAVVWTKASALFMPVLFNPHSLYIATVSEK